MPKFNIVGHDLQAVVCELAPGEVVVSETGHLLTLDENLDLQTNAGGLMSGLKRMFGGASFFVNHVVAQRGPGSVTFSSPTPGHIQELDISPQGGWYCQPHVFLCSENSVEISAGFTQRLGAGLFGGAGFVLQTLQGSGKAFIHVGGTSLKFELGINQSMRVATGALAAFQSSVHYDIQMVRGLKSILFSGEGLWFAHLRGPGTVIVQSLALPHLANALAPYLPGPAEVTTGGAAGVGAVLGGLIGNMGSDSNDY